MSVTPDGKVYCDKCGVDLGNGNIYMCVIVSDLDPADDNMIRNLHFCRDQKDEAGDKIVHKGCSRVVLSDANLSEHNKRRRSGKDETATGGSSQRGRKASRANA